MKRKGVHDPAGWDGAVEIDAALRDKKSVATRGFRQELYVHRSCVPLPLIDFDSLASNRLDPMTVGECHGMCGVCRLTSTACEGAQPGVRHARCGMNPWKVFPTIRGYEWVEGRLRLYVDGPYPKTSFTRDRGVRTALFHLYDGDDAEAIRGWLAANRAWQCMRVPPPFSPERAARAILIAGDWHGGTTSAVYLLSRTRIFHDELHRERLLGEVRATIQSVLENPVGGNEFGDLQLLEDVIHVAPLGIELATSGELVDAHFGSA